MKQPIVACAAGDGIGPEIMSAVRRILDSAGAPIQWNDILLGEQAYLAGHSAGIPPEAWGIIRNADAILKAPLTTPQGGGYKSVNVTLRKSLGLYANVRPCVGYAPFVPTRHPGIDLVIVRENEEDLYAGIEHRQTDDVVQCLKLITRPGCERIVRYAFEYARANGRSKVTCMSKDNIMKLTDGLFRSVFEEIANDYPEIATEHMIIDIGAARLADSPERFDVIVTGNLYGDILSDIAAQVAGSVGLAGSSNIGMHGALFEAVHGSAPDIAGNDIANPSGLLQAAVQMLVHLGFPALATTIQNAWLCTLEEGIHTADIRPENGTGTCVGTRAFADAVIERLGRRPATLRPASFAASPTARPVLATTENRPPADKVLVGVDVFVHWRGSDPSELAARLTESLPSPWKLSMITNRGVKVWPNGLPETFCTDHWRCRFKADDGSPVSNRAVLHLLDNLETLGVDFIKTEQLYEFDGVPGYAVAQGQ
ncbi:MAG: NADP-dependent isocitrate dehydrogenase [Armatimonadaceae bacterium]